jgi:hypothetical protein
MKLLLEDLKRKKMIYIRSPRGSAKSSIRYLLEKQATSEENGFSKVVSILGTDWTNKKLNDYNLFLQQQIGEPTITSFAEKHANGKPLLIILDDFQAFFELKELSSDLKSFAEIQKTRNVVLLMLATHGEQTLGRNTSTPITFLPGQQKDISFLLFDKLEYEKALKTFNERSPIGKYILDLEKTFSLFNLTSGHPGLLAWSLIKIETKFEKQLSSLNVKTILNYIYSDEFLDSLTLYKTFDTLIPYNDESHKSYDENCERAKKELMKLIDSKQQSLKIVDSEITTKDEISRVIANFLMKSGITVINENEIKWSFDYMRIFWLRKLSNKSTKEVEIKDTHSFINEYVKQLPIDRLKDSMFFGDVEKKNIENESFWQNEFYRIVVEKFGIQKIYPEFGGEKKKGEGKIDFYINSSKKWLIEFFVGDDERKDYYARFNTKDGKYKDFDHNNFQIVNFVIQRPGIILERWKGMTFLYFNPADNFKKATLFLFRRKTRSEIAKNVQIVDGNEWLKDGDYEESIIEFTNLTYSKTLSLQLFKENNLLGRIKMQEIPITLDAFKFQIQKMFKLNQNQKFILVFDEKQIERDEQLAMIPERATVDVQII